MGKYARDTQHLTMLEHGAYNLLLDYYYSTGGLPSSKKQCKSNAELMPDHCRVYRVCNALTKTEQDAVDYVLNMFFILDKKGFYMNPRADTTIEEQTLKHENRVNAPKKAKARRERAMQEQCKSNTPQTKTKTKTLKPPTPLKRGGVETDVSGKKKRKVDNSRYNIEIYLDDDAIQEAKKQAPEWDIYYLINMYNEGIRSGKRDRPDNPKKAFPAWCASYTKGKQP